MNQQLGLTLLKLEINLYFIVWNQSSISLVIISASLSQTSATPLLPLKL